MEVLVITDAGVMIQDISGWVPPITVEAKIRMPGRKDLKNIRNALTISLRNIEEIERRQKETKQLQLMMLKVNIKKYGKENVRAGEDGSIYVTDDGKEHRIWVEST